MEGMTTVQARKPAPTRTAPTNNNPESALNFCKPSVIQLDTDPGVAEEVPVGIAGGGILDALRLLVLLVAALLVP